MISVQSSSRSTYLQMGSLHPMFVGKTDAVLNDNPGSVCDWALFNGRWKTIREMVATNLNRSLFKPIGVGPFAYTTQKFLAGNSFVYLKKSSFP